jgi:UDP-N-acetylmuramate--alanine ligase
MDLRSGQHVFFAGIGGCSMSGLAHALLADGYQISGSDQSDSATVERLRGDGAVVHIGHDAHNVEGADVVVRTTAVPEDNPEIVAARQLGLPVYHRSELLAWLCRGKRGLAVSGTHGKSSTTAMAATIFLRCGLNPSVFVGAESPMMGGNFRVGGGEWIVFEACESDGSFVHYVGTSQVLTSIEADHLDQHGTFEGVVQAFRDFVAVGDPQGFIVYCADSDIVRAVAGGSPARQISYGLEAPADFTARDLRMDSSGSGFTLCLHGEPVTQVSIPVIGKHMVSNATAALACAWAAGLDLREAAATLADYQAVGRRFELLGEGRGVRVVDDYAHHPTEIRATLRASRRVHPGRIIAIFQPHLRSRTRDLLEGFAQAFVDADHVILTDIYQPRDDGLQEFDVAELVKRVQATSPSQPVELILDKSQIAGALLPQLQPGDLVLTIGAGDIYKVGQQLAVALAQ